jgi:very-short-patch-repair endonuclease
MLKPKGNEAEMTLAYQCAADGIQFQQEYRFNPQRRYRLDLAIPPLKLGIEIDGAIFSQGAHSRPLGILRDMEKANLLVLSGWRVLRYTPAQVKAGEAIDGLKQLIAGAKSWNTTLKVPQSVNGSSV